MILLWGVFEIYIEWFIIIFFLVFGCEILVDILEILVYKCMKNVDYCSESKGNF